jgi:hypothetical protein
VLVKELGLAKKQARRHWRHVRRPACWSRPPTCALTGTKPVA